MHISDVYLMLSLFLDFFQVKIQKDSEVRLKIIGTRVDATEIVSPHTKTRSLCMICAKDMNALLIFIIENRPRKLN